MGKLWLNAKKYRLEGIYLLILLLVVISNQSANQSALIIKGILIVSLWLLPYFLNLRFKIINTVILACSINWISSTFFQSDQNDAGRLAVVVAIMLFVALILNIFLVIKEMYQRKAKDERKRNGLKLAYVLLAFAMLIGTVVMSYSHIYENILANDPSAFAVSSPAGFSAFYFSSTTYFTVGYGDITPVSDLARSVCISQMIFGYVITCMILPTILVAFQKLFRTERVG